MAKQSAKGRAKTEIYEHHEQVVLRPDAGTQAQFKKRRPPRTYRYDSAMSPALEWDSQSATRELGEWLIAQIEEAAVLAPPNRFAEPRRHGDVVVEGLIDGVQLLRRLSRPFLNWAGKAERLSFDVPTMPLFVHERLSTKAILETIEGHARDRQIEMRLFGDPQLSLAQQLEAYEHTGGWVNRLILGDSLVVMNSLLDYEGLGGEIQMVYIDPPYGVNFRSNFQPFVRNRDVKDGEDASMTREPEMVKAYRDTWELGIHSYLTYLRDRLLVARDLLTTSGSVFVQISDQNVHHVREVMDEIFDSENFVATINFQTMTPLESGEIESVYDYVLWYARDKSSMKYRNLFVEKPLTGNAEFKFYDLGNGLYRELTRDEMNSADAIDTSRIFKRSVLESSGFTRSCMFPVEFDGVTYNPRGGKSWRTNEAGMARLRGSHRLFVRGTKLYYKLFHSDFGHTSLVNSWPDTVAGYAKAKLYVVQTHPKVIQRCMLMATDPGDLVLDPTCGSGTTAYVAEQWGRRWITVDTSRVPLALTRQRLLTATYPYYELQDQHRGPAGGFVYKRRQNSKGEESGGIVPHVTLESIAQAEPPREEVLVDRPEVSAQITRVTGPFCLEATIPTPLNGDAHTDKEEPDDGSFIDRMIEVLRRNPVLQLGGNRVITLAKIRPPAKSLTIAAEAELESDSGAIALVFGPENGAISERLVYEGAREAHAKGYARLILIGFAIEAAARELVDKCADLVGIPALYVQATPDLVMGDLLKTMRSSQIFSVTGLPDVSIRRVPSEEKGGPQRYQVELRGLDIFDPVTMAAEHRAGSDVPAWFLDTDYNNLCFLVSQAFFPRTSAWDSLRKALKGGFEESVWDHLAGTTSAPFVAGQSRKVAVKVVDDRGNELLVVRSLDQVQ